MNSRPLLFALLSIAALIFSAPVVGHSSPAVLNSALNEVNAACAFLEKLYNPALGLVRSTNDSSVYYIASDNLLAQAAMRHCIDPTAQADAASINQTITNCCNGGNDGVHEILLNRPIKIPIKSSNTYTIANSSAGQYFNKVTPTEVGANYTVLQEEHNSTAPLQDCGSNGYGDIAAYTALEDLGENNVTGAKNETNCLGVMWDGTGIADAAFKSGTGSELGIYQTYKLALLAYAYARVYGSVPYDWTALFALAGPDGGLHTGYNRTLGFAGTKENSETTSIVIIALSLPLPPRTVICNCPSLFNWFWIGLLALATIAIGTVLVWDHRKKKTFQQPVALVKQSLAFIDLS